MIIYGIWNTKCYDSVLQYSQCSHGSGLCRCACSSVLMLLQCFLQCSTICSCVVAACVTALSNHTLIHLIKWFFLKSISTEQTQIHAHIHCTSSFSEPKIFTVFLCYCNSYSPANLEKKIRDQYITCNLSKTFS